MKSLRILLVEDNEADAFYFRELIQDIHHLALTLQVAKDLKSATQKITNEHFDVIFLDLGLPDSLGIDTFDQLKRQVQATPIVVFTGSTATDGGIEIVQKGAQDYLVKGAVSADLLSKTMLYATARFKYEIVKQELDQARIEIATIATAKSRFLANVSHELGTPLTAALGYLQLLYGSDTMSEIDRDRVVKALSAGRRLQGVVSNVIEAAKMEVEEVELALDALSISSEAQNLEEAFQARCEAKNLELNVDWAGIDHALLDQSKFRFMLNALLTNAVQHTELGSITARLTQDNEQMRFEISDTGCGIASELHGRLFDSFQHDMDYLRTAGRGAGLSLYICKSYVDAMNGSLTVESDGSSGSKFTIVLPRRSGVESELSTIVPIPSIAANNA